jgi:CheY-like chemotaxis protein
MVEVFRALVVDDQPGVTRGIALMLEREFEVDTAAGFHEAADLVRGIAYALVLTDLNMEYEDAGIRLLALVAELQPDAIRVLITGGTPPREHAAHALLRKPFAPDELRAVLAGMA